MAFKRAPAAATPAAPARAAPPAVAVSAGPGSKYGINPTDPEYQYLVIDRAALLEAGKDYDAKKSVWVSDDKDGFVPARIDKQTGNETTVVLSNGTLRTVSSKDDISEMNPPKFEMINDMSDLTFLNEACVLHNLRTRYRSMIIYVSSKKRNKIKIKLLFFLSMLKLNLILDLFWFVLCLCQPLPLVANLF